MGWYMENCRHNILDTSHCMCWLRLCFCVDFPFPIYICIQFLNIYVLYSENLCADNVKNGLQRLEAAVNSNHRFSAQAALVCLVLRKLRCVQLNCVIL